MNRLKTNNVSTLALYLLIIGLVFLQIPLNHALPGNLDTWANLAMFRDFKNGLVSLITHSDRATFVYPCHHVWVLFGLDFFSGIIFWPFKLFGFSDMWAYYFYLTTIYALNSFAVYKFCRLYCTFWYPAFLGGLFFSISNFMLGNAGNPNITCCFAGILALWLLVSGISNYKSTCLVWSIILLGFQIFMAPVTFMLFAFAWGLYLIFHLKLFYKLIKPNKLYFAAGLIIFGACISPYVFFYFIANVPAINYNQLKPLEYASHLSINLDDFLRPLPNNLFIKNNNSEIPFFRCAYFGLTFSLLLISSGFARVNKKFPLLIAFGGILIAMGPCIAFKNHCLFYSPMFPVYKLLPVSNYLRIPARALILGMLGLCALSSIALTRILQFKSRTANFALAVIPVFYLLENLAFPINYFRVSDELKNLSYQQNVIERLPVHNVLNLPSSLFLQQDEREYIYMYEQTFHKKNTINGSLAYFPPARLLNDSLCKNAESAGALESLIELNGIDLVIFHADLSKPGEMKILNTLESSSLLSVIDTTTSRKIFAVQKKHEGSVQTSL